MGMSSYTVRSLVKKIDDIYNGDHNPDTQRDMDAQQILEGVIGVLRVNPDVNVECHFEAPIMQV